MIWPYPESILSVTAKKGLEPVFEQFLPNERYLFEDEDAYYYGQVIENQLILRPFQKTNLENSFDMKFYLKGDS